MATVNSSTGSPVAQASAPVSSSAQDGFGRLAEITAQNNAWNAEQVMKANKRNEDMTVSLSMFNADQAKQARAWQQYMSDTAHQREVADLIKAGINPVLTATGGSGASTPSGASGSGSSYTASQAAKADESGASAMASIMGTLMQSMTALATSNANALNQMAIADKTNAVSKILGELGLQGALASASATRYASDMSYASAENIAKNYPSLDRFQATLLSGLTGGDLGTRVRNAGKDVVTVLKDIFTAGTKDISGKEMYTSSFKGFGGGAGRKR